VVCGSNAYGFFVKFLNSDWMHPIVFPPVVAREIKKHVLGILVCLIIIVF